MKKQATLADSVTTGKELPLGAEHFDSAIVPKSFKNLQWGKHIPLTVKNTDTHERTDTFTFAVKNETYTLKPIEKNVQPFISYVQHPKPVKAGELRSTGLSNENIMYLNEEQGLPSSQIKWVVEDPKGFLWIAQNAGLTKYDGYNFYTYNTKNGLPSNNINKVLINKDSSLWIATTAGLVHYDGKKFKIYNTQCGLPGNVIQDITLDAEGNVWFVCFEKAAVKLKDNKISIYDESCHIQPGALYKIGTDSANNIVLANWGGMPFYIEKEKTGRKFIQEVMIHTKDLYLLNTARFGSDVNTAIYLDKKKRLWLGSYTGGVAQYSKERSICYRPRTGMPWFLFSAILEDSKGKVWMGSGEGGVAKMDSSGFLCYTTKQGLTSNKILCMMEDSQKNIWIGTQDGGLNRIKPESFRNYSALDGLTDKGIVSLAVNKKGEVIIGSWGGGFYTFNGSTFRHYAGSAIILSILEDHKANLFTTIHGFGVDMYKPSTSDTCSYDSLFHLSGIRNFNSYFSYSSTTPNKNEVWFGNADGTGINRYLYSSFDRISRKEGLVNGKVTCMVHDQKGVVWIINQQAGISRIEGHKITHFTKANGLPSNEVNTLFIDSNNDLWLGTTAGVCKYNGTTFNCIDSRDGLSSNSVTSIVEDDKHRLWLGTTRGLNVLIPDPNQNKGYLIDYFLLQDGLKTNAFANHAVAYDKINNNLWWGTTKGALKLNLNNYNSQRQSPPTFLTQVALMDEYVNFASLQDSIQKKVNYFNSDSSRLLNGIKYSELLPFNNIPVHLILPHNINTINFNFYAYHGNPAHRTKYRYRLIGYDDTWIHVNYPEAKFSNLDAGHYTFEAQAKLEGEEWGQACNYSFDVSPPFWKTWWFRLLSLAAVVYGIILIFRFRNKQLLERQQQLETTVKERTSEIEHQKHLIEEKQKEIVDSINYAKRIQYALLAHEDVLKQNLSDYFIYFNPKDIVSGDFYWSTKKDDRFYLAVCDSTGHGVPGAFMSLLNIGFLTEAITEKGIEKPNEIFNYVRQKLIDNISKEGQKDGFDGILICIDRKNKKLSYASANNRPVVISNNKVDEQESDRMPVGVGVREESFKLFEIEVRSDDILYLYTDGFADQFGGPKGKKFKYGQLNQLLLDISQKQLSVQKQILQDSFNTWKGALEQVDDVCVIGLKI